MTNTGGSLSARKPVNLFSRAEQVALDCRDVACRLAKGAVRAKRLRELLRGVNVIVGLSAVTAAYIEPIPQLLGTSGIQLVALCAAVVLIFDGVSPMFLGNDTYERFSEYSFYIRGFGEGLLNALADDTLPEDVRRARIAETLAMATKNLDDVRAKWPWVDSP